MPEWVAIILILGMLVGLGFFVWKLHLKEERRKKEEAQRKHEYKMRGTNLKREKIQLEHELKMKKINDKNEKAQMKQEFKGQKPNSVEVIKAIGENVSDINVAVKDIVNVKIKTNKKSIKNEDEIILISNGEDT